MSEKVVCNFCKKEYNSIYILNSHQKTAKFCLAIQNKINNEELNKCEHCDKEFTNKKYLNQHLEHCKSKRKLDENEIKDYYKNLENENKELKFKHELEIKFKDETIYRLEKELEEYKKMINRPTTVYNTNNNNYQIQYNQLVQELEKLNGETICNKIKSISIEEIDNYDPKHLEDSIINSLTNILKDYTFCTDKSRKIVVIKKDDGTIQKINIETFVNMCIELGIDDIRKFLKMLEEHYDTKMGEYRISDEDFTFFDDTLRKIKEYMDKTDINFADNGNPLKDLCSKILISCKQLNK
jgi:hypothetical protein